MKESWWKSVRDFTNINRNEIDVEFELPEKSKWILEKFPKFKQKKVTVRLVLVELENGEKEVLCTSLINRKKYVHSIFKELYHFRWNIEEAYKLFKARAEVENFSDKTALSVKQDFFAKIFSMSLCAVLSFPIEEKVRKESKQANHKYEKKINRTSALAMLKDISIRLFIKKEFNKAIHAFDSIVEKTTEIIRPGKNFLRKKRPKKLYYMNYKPF